MAERVKRWSNLVVGMVAGIALVISCGDHMRPGDATSPPSDMSSPASAGSCCTIDGPIAIQQPVAVTAAADGLAVSGTVAVSGIGSAVNIAGPVDVNVASPVSIAGPIKTITAETDAHQLQSGSVFPAAFAWALLAKGPFVLTDAALQYTTSSAAPQIAVVSGTDCGSAATSTFQMAFNATTPLHGGRIFVPSGSVLCATTSGNTIIWSGYATY